MNENQEKIKQNIEDARKMLRDNNKNYEFDKILNEYENKINTESNIALIERDKELERESESKAGLIFSAIPKVMGKLKAVGKNQEVKSNGPRWKFRGIDDVYNAVQKCMSECEVFCVPKILNRSRKDIKSKSGTLGVHAIYEYRYRFYAKDGSFIDAFTDGESIDWADKVSNKVASFAQKYALLQVFCIATEDMQEPDRTNYDENYSAESKQQTRSFQLQDVRNQARNLSQSEADKTQSKNEPFKKQTNHQGLVTAFLALNVNQSQLLKRCAVQSIEKLSEQHVKDLRVIYNTIKNGEASPEQYFK